MRWAVCILLCLAGFPAFAAGGRFAIVAGNNSGAGADRKLRFAEEDARKVRDVLMELGGFEAANVSCLLGKTSTDVKNELRRISEKIKKSEAEKSLFIFYYSGHADENGLKLGGSRLSNSELKELIASSGASVRIGVVDACHSGSLTRAKGGAAGEDFTVTMEAGSSQEGDVLITSSRGEEKSLESDELRGSFFTHYFASAMRGDADASGDGKVSLAEAYQYAYQRTVVETASQHPSFDYDLKGTGEVVLTELDNLSCSLIFPARIEGRFIVYRAGTLAVVAEVEKDASSERRLHVKPGPYFVKKKEENDTALLGKFALNDGESVVVNEGLMKRITLSEDFTKGSSEEPVFTMEARAGVQSFLSAEARDEIAAPAPLFGFALSGRKFPFEAADLRFDLSFCRSGQQLDLTDEGGHGFSMPVRLTEVETGVAMPLNLRLGQISIFSGPRLSAFFIHRSFRHRDEQYFVFYPGIQAGAGYDLSRHLLLRADVNLNYLYLKFGEEKMSVGTVEAFVGIGLMP